MTATKHYPNQTASHTPGPWSVSQNDIWGKSPWSAHFRIASVTMPSSMNGIDWQANARLIAAAPQLLEALETLREDIRMLRTGEWEPDEDSCAASMAIADAAIAEAKGMAA